MIVIFVNSTITLVSVLSSVSVLCCVVQYKMSLLSINGECVVQLVLSVVYHILCSYINKLVYGVCVNFAFPSIKC